MIKLSIPHMVMIIVIFHASFMFTQLSVSYYSDDVAHYWSQTPFTSFGSAIVGVVWLKYGFLEEFGKYVMPIRIVLAVPWVIILVGIVGRMRRLI